MKLTATNVGVFLSLSDGRLFWKERPREMFESYRIFRSWNAKNAGKEAGFVHKKDGYRRIQFGGESYLAHRIVWLIENGEWPEDLLDHFDRDRDHNDIGNLRPANFGINAKNRKLSVKNKSGYPGIVVRKGRFMAMIKSGGRRWSLGTFSTFEAAVARRKEEEAKLGFTPHHGEAA